MKKTLQNSLLILGLAFTSQALAAGKAPVPLTALVVPAHYTPVQVGMDMASRYPAVLISYQQGAAGDTSLHAWSGSRWIPVSMDDFAQASFLKMTPSRVLVVGESNTAMDLIAVAEGWAPQVFNLASENSADMVNTLGQLFEFNSGEWRWFANRYNMDIQDLNNDRRATSWYDQPYVDERRSSISGVVVEPYQQQERSAYVQETSAYIHESHAVVENVAVEEAYVAPEPALVLPSAQLSAPSRPVARPAAVRTSAPTLPAFRGWSESATAGDVPSK